MIALGAAWAVLVTADGARALGVQAPFPVALRARLALTVVALDASGEWVATSRSPSDPSRFMADLAAGNAAWGTLYLKGVSSWQDADDAQGRVDFRLDQGDYFRAFSPGDSTTLALRLFGDERRFFTNEYGAPVVEDDAVARFEHRLGARADVSGGAVRGTYWFSSLDDNGDTRFNQYLAARVAARPVFAALAYVHDDPARGEDHAIVKGEAGGYFRKATAIVSYEQSGYGNGAFLPSGTWDSFDPGGFARAAPENAATFAELRARRLRAGENHLFDVSWRYGAVGPRYTNDLSSLAPGTVGNAAYVNWAHRQYALDARLELANVVSSGALHADHRALQLSSRARLKNNAEVLLRGGGRRDQAGGDGAERSGFLHAAFTRELQGFLGGAHVLVDRMGSGATASAGAEARVNWNATSAVYARWIVTDAAAGGDAVFVRLEFRPTRRTWVTLAWGRPELGDDAYFLEDRDARPAPDAGERVVLTVRGDL